MRCGERCRRAVCGRTACTVRYGAAGEARTCCGAAGPGPVCWKMPPRWPGRDLNRSDGSPNQWPTSLLQRTGHNDRVTPNSEPLELAALRHQFELQTLLIMLLQNGNEGANRCVWPQDVSLCEWHLYAPETLWPSVCATNEAVQGVTTIKVRNPWDTGVMVRRPIRIYS